MSWAYVFPGQGSQTVGMGKELAAAFAEAREIFQEVDEALKQKLSALMFEGPQDTLTLTENAQPALMAVSMAVVKVLEKQGNLSIRNTARYVAGHSLGEYSALAAAGSLTVSDAARLLKTRGQAMQKAKADSVDAWSEYQASRVKLHVDENSLSQLLVVLIHRTLNSMAITNQSQRLRKQSALA